MAIDKLEVIAESKLGFESATNKKQAHEACWLLYGSFYRLFCHLGATEGPLDLGWGQKYPRELLAATRVVAGQPTGRPLRQLNEFRTEFNVLSSRIPAEQSFKPISLQDIRNFGDLLLRGHELIARDPMVSNFVAAKSMEEDLDESLLYVHRSLVQK